ncbi:MAG: hypothetical protein ABWZ89_11245 [Acidimicrobiales bacterium]
MTDLGVLGAGRLGAVDASGGLRPAGAGWTLGWLIGAEDRWHVPPVEAAVRQSLVGSTPVVETRVRVVGGDVVHHAYAVTGPGGAAMLVAEITNETPVPVAIALVVDGAGSVDLDGEVATVDGHHQVRLPRPASQWVAPVAFLPLPHKATLRVVVARGEAADPAELPDAERVAAGWRAQADASPSWSLPEPVISAAADAARGFLLVHDEPDLLTTALSAEARHLVGLRDERGTRADLAARQRLTGAFEDGTGSLAATGQALVALGSDPDPALIGPVAKAGHWIERKRRVRRHRKDSLRAGLLPPGPQPLVLGAADQTYLDDWWSVAGLVRAAGLLDAEGQLEASVDAWRFARGLAADVDRSIAAVLAPDLLAQGSESEARTGAIPAGPGRALDAGVVGVVVAAALGALDPEAPAVVATLDLVRAELVSEAGGVRAGVLSDDGWSPWLTALLARVEIGQGDRAGLTRLRALAAAGAGVWPELIGGEPRVPVDLADHHPPATAAFLLATRALLLVERGPFLDRPDRLAVLPVAVPEWYGQGLELHDAPTAFGPFGFAVRWHADRPALLWALDPAAGAPPFRLECPGLDPDWSSTEPKGEALLAPWPPEGSGADTEVSFS